MSGGSPRVLIVQIPRQKLVWWEDGDAWTASLTVEDDRLWQPQSQTQWAFARPFTDDEVWAPAPVSPAFDEDYWLIDQYVPHVFAKAFVADEDVWPKGFSVDEDYLWSNRFRPYFTPRQAFLSDDDVWPTPLQPFGLDEDYWLINRYARYVLPLQAFRIEEDWPTPGTPAGAMPNLVGLYYPVALQLLVSLGIRVLPFVYFKDDPVILTWVLNPAVRRGFVVSQIPAAGTPNIVPNSPIFLTVSNWPMSVSYPGGEVNV